MSRLSEYAVHRAGCTSNEFGRNLRHCDCGLKEALELDANEQVGAADRHNYRAKSARIGWNDLCEICSQPPAAHREPRN